MERIKKIFKQVNDQYGGPIVLNRDDRDTNRHLPFTDEKAVSAWLAHVDQPCEPFGIYPWLLSTLNEDNFSCNEGGGRTNEEKE